MEKQRLLRILRIFYQAFRLITGKLKEEIDEIEKDLSKSDAQRLAEAKEKHNLIKYNDQQS